MDIVLGITCLLFLGYFLLLIFFLWSWNKIPTVGLTRTGEMRVTVVVPVREEASGIENCIDSILEQDYAGEFEVIIVDDHSTDGTPDIVSRRYDSMPNVKLILLADRPTFGKGKKAALSCGILESSGDIIVTTDGDCVFSPGWLGIIINCFDDAIQIVTGPVLYPESDTMLGGFQALDLLSLALVTGAGIQNRNYFLGNGANLAFRKDAFTAVNGFSGNETYASGDDLFLIEKIVDQYGSKSIGYAKSFEATVLTHSPKTWPAFFNQRVRWASKNRALSGRRIYYMWIFIWIVNAVMLASLIMAILGFLTLGYVALLLYAKMLIEGIVLYRVSVFFNMTGSMRWFPWGFFLNILYVISIGMLAILNPSFNWKGRKEGVVS